MPPKRSSKARAKSSCVNQKQVDRSPALVKAGDLLQGAVRTVTRRGAYINVGLAKDAWLEFTEEWQCRNLSLGDKLSRLRVIRVDGLRTEVSWPERSAVGTRGVDSAKVDAGDANEWEVCVSRTARRRSRSTGGALRSRATSDVETEDDGHLCEGEASLCPVCLKTRDGDDLRFQPCPCGYAPCVWCVHRICETLNPCCPACRQPYLEERLRNFAHASPGLPAPLGQTSHQVAKPLASPAPPVLSGWMANAAALKLEEADLAAALKLEEETQRLAVSAVSAVATPRGKSARRRPCAQPPHESVALDAHRFSPPFSPTPAKSSSAPVERSERRSEVMVGQGGGAQVGGQKLPPGLGGPAAVDNPDGVDVNANSIYLSEVPFAFDLDTLRRLHSDAEVDGLKDAKLSRAGSSSVAVLGYRDADCARKAFRMLRTVSVPTPSGKPRFMIVRCAPNLVERGDEGAGADSDGGFWSETPWSASGSLQRPLSRPRRAALRPPPGLALPGTAAGIPSKPPGPNEGPRQLVEAPVDDACDQTRPLLGRSARRLRGRRGARASGAITDTETPEAESMSLFDMLQPHWSKNDNKIEHAQKAPLVRERPPPPPVPVSLAPMLIEGASKSKPMQFEEFDEEDLTSTTSSIPPSRPPPPSLPPGLNLPERLAGFPLPDAAGRVPATARTQCATAAVRPAADTVGQDNMAEPLPVRQGAEASVAEVPEVRAVGQRNPESSWRGARGAARSGGVEHVRRARDLLEKLMAEDGEASAPVSVSGVVASNSRTASSAAPSSSSSSLRRDAEVRHVRRWEPRQSASNSRRQMAIPWSSARAGRGIARRRGYGYVCEAASRRQAWPASGRPRHRDSKL